MIEKRLLYGLRSCCGEVCEGGDRRALHLERRFGWVKKSHRHKRLCEEGVEASPVKWSYSGNCEVVMQVGVRCRLTKEISISTVISTSQIALSSGEASWALLWPAVLSLKTPL
jgi:hypothetical protein